MGFSFRLETLLNWKKTLEELSQERLFEKREELRLREEEIHRLTLMRTEWDRKLSEELKQGMKGCDYLLFKEFADASRGELSLKEKGRGEILKEITEEQERLIDFMKERKTLDRLKEKSRKRYYRLMDKQEQKTVDEIVTCHSPDPKTGFGKIL
jgi:flagellar FliJ protein